MNHKIVSQKWIFTILISMPFRQYKELVSCFRHATSKPIYDKFKSKVYYLALQNVPLLPWTTIVNKALFLMCASRITNWNTKRSRKMDAQNSWETALYYGRIYCIPAFWRTDLTNLICRACQQRSSSGVPDNRAVLGIKLPNNDL